jgi:signal transduction histidine kinase
MEPVQAKDGNRPYLVQFKWFHSFQFAGYYAALEKGFYKDEGLKVILRERQIESTPVEDVLNGHADFGVAESSLVNERLQGKPVVLLGVIMQRSPLVIISLAENNITNPLDLVGKKVMYQRNADNVSIESAFSEVGLSKDDYTHVRHNFNDMALLEDDVDAMSAYLSDQPLTYRELGHKINIMDPASYGVDFYGDNFFTSESLIRTQPEKVMAFRRATIKGWKYALEHPLEVYRWLNSKYINHREKKSQKLYMDEVRVIRRMINPDVTPIGEMNPHRLQRIADVYKQTQLAPVEAELDDRFYYSGYLLSNQGPYKTWFLFLLLGVLIIAALLGLNITINRRLKYKVAQRTEALEKANNAKTEFMASMSHELRTPLNSIIGYSERLLKKYSDDWDDRAVDSMETIKRNGTHLLNLINDILDLAKIDSGKFELFIKPCHIQELIEDTASTLTHQISEKKHTLILPTVYPFTILMADPVRLTQVLLNILGNAIKYTPAEGQIKVTVDKRKLDDQLYCRISIIDNGKGISEEQQALLFKRFEQFDPETKRKIGAGTGLGLSLSHEMIKLHHGHIKYHSEVDEGSTFSIYLPIQDEDLQK